MMMMMMMMMVVVVTAVYTNCNNEVLIGINSKHHNLFLMKIAVQFSHLCRSVFDCDDKADVGGSAGPARGVDGFKLRCSVHPRCDQAFDLATGLMMMMMMTMMMIIISHNFL